MRCSAGNNFCDVLYAKIQKSTAALNAPRVSTPNYRAEEPAALLPELTDKAATLTDSTISIYNLLDYVNKYFTEPSETTEKEAVIHRKS